MSIEQARLALTSGRLDDANRLVTEALRQAQEASATTGAHGPEALATTLRAQIATTLGQLDQARAHAYEGARLAEAEADEQAQVEAALAAAEVELLAENLQVAVGAFNHAQAVAQVREATVADALSSVGLGRILLRRELWEEAASTFQEALPRLRAAEDVAAQALAQISLGEARRNLDDDEGAENALSEAARLARESGNPLLESEALGGAARALLEKPDPQAAVERYNQSRALVERVGAALGDIGDRAAFYDGYASLYAEAIFAGAQANAATTVNELASTFAAQATRSGRSSVSQRLREYAQVTPTTGRELEADARERNDRIVALLNSARKTLGR